MTANLPLRHRISLLSGADNWHTQALGDIPAILLADGPHGLRVQPDAEDYLGITGSKPATCFPPAVTLASSWDESLLAEVGAAVGAEARASGVGVVLGPGMNLKRHPCCGRNFEYLSEDPLLTGRLAAALVDGIQSRGVGACVKHFAVNNQESHRLVVDVVVDERTLRELYLSGFEHVVRTASPWTIMAAYNSVGGNYCTDSHRLLTQVLRDEWGFDGLVMSDWGATNDRVAGVYAGMDLEMPGSGGVFDADVADAVASGKLAQSAVTASADRVVALVARAPRTPGPAVDVDAADELARRAAACSTVLLSNDGILPLVVDATTTIGVVGAFAQQPRYQGFGSSKVQPHRVTTALDALREAGINFEYAPGYDPQSSEPNDALIHEAVALAERVDTVVLMAGLPGMFEGEGFDRTDLRLPAQHDRLIDAVCAVNPRTVVALSNGAPIAMPWVHLPAAIVESYLGGQASGGALIDVLLGLQDPQGRLAETFPATLDQVAADPFFPGSPRQVEYREGLFVGYRHTTTAGLQPLFPFGHGLSYTSFELGTPLVDQTTISAGGSVRVSVPITNTGSRRGTQVVQLYVHDRTAVVLRPRRELRQFAKVDLAPGERRTVELQLASRAFSFYDVQERDWAIPTGEFDIEIGFSSQDIHHSLTVTVTQGCATAVEGPDSPTVARTDSDFAARLRHPIPTPAAVLPFTRLTTVGELRLHPLGRVVRAALHRFTRPSLTALAADDPVLLDLLDRALDEMPLRGAVLFAGGAVRWPVLDALLALLNRTTLRRTTLRRTILRRR